MSVVEANISTGLVGVWKDKFADGVPTYKLLSDGVAQYTKDDAGVGTSQTAGFGKWELTSGGQVQVTCKVNSGCTSEKDGVGGKEEHLLSMHCMMFEGVFRRQQQLNERDEERVRMLSQGQDVPPLHQLIVIDAEGSEKAFGLFHDEKLSNLKERLGFMPDDDKKKIMLGDTEITEGETLYKQTPAGSVLRIVVPKPEAAAAAAPAADEEGSKKEKISEAFRKWDTTNKGLIAEEDLSRILVALGVPQDDIATIFAHADAKKGGSVDYAEFINWIYTSATKAK